MPEIVLRHHAKPARGCGAPSGDADPGEPWRLAERLGHSGLRWTCGGVTRVRSHWRDAGFGTVGSVEYGPCFGAKVNMESFRGRLRLSSRVLVR